MGEDVQVTSPRPARPDGSAPPSLYRERLAPPPLWWVIGAALALSFAVAVGAALGTGVGVGLFVALVALEAAALLSMTLTVEVDEHELRAGTSAIPHAARGPAHALDVETTRRLRGRDADPAAFSVVRSYVATAVAFEVRDPQDATPYWLVSTRHPADLLEVLRQLDGAGRAG